MKYDARGLPSNIKLFATAALFDIKEKDFVVAQAGPTNPFEHFQGGEVEVKGLELEFVGRFQRTALGKRILQLQSQRSD